MSNEYIIFEGKKSIDREKPMEFLKSNWLCLECDSNDLDGGKLIHLNNNVWGIFCTKCAKERVNL